MTFSAELTLELSPMSSRHIELFFGGVGLRSSVNALLVTQVFKFAVRPEIGTTLENERSRVIDLLVHLRKNNPHTCPADIRIRIGSQRCSGHKYQNKPMRPYY